MQSILCNSNYFEAGNPNRETSISNNEYFAEQHIYIKTEVNSDTKYGKEQSDNTREVADQYQIKCDPSLGECFEKDTTVIENNNMECDTNVGVKIENSCEVAEEYGIKLEECTEMTSVEGYYDPNVSGMRVINVGEYEFKKSYALKTIETKDDEQINMIPCNINTNLNELHSANGIQIRKVKQINVIHLHLLHPSSFLC